MGDYVEYEIVVCSTGGMQLSEGCIRVDDLRVSGYLPALVCCTGATVGEVRQHLDQEAKDYYGYDVAVEIVHSHVVAA